MLQNPETRRLTVAQIKISTGYSLPLSHFGPFSVTSTISPYTTSTLLFPRDSRYPTPGVRRRHPRDHSGINFSSRAGLLSFNFICSVMYLCVSVLISLFLRKSPNWPLRPVSTSLRYLSSSSGFVAKIFFSSSLKRCCSRPCIGDTQVGSLMKVVHLLTEGWMVGRTWMPDELDNVRRSYLRRLEYHIPISNQADMLAGKIHWVVPIGSM